MISARHGYAQKHASGCYHSLCIDMLEGGIEGGSEGKEGAREGGRNQLLLVHNVIKF